MSNIRDNRYLLTVVIAKRAKQISERIARDKIMGTTSHKPVVLALKEFEEGKLEYEIPEGK